MIRDLSAAPALLDRCAAAPDRFAAVEAALGTLIGHRLFTVMAVDPAKGEAARVHSNRPAEYPVRGRKPLGRMTGWGRHVIEGRRAWIGRNAEDIRWAFFDHETIAALGCASCLNVPVLDGGAVIGTVNLLHEAEFYGEADAEAAAPFGALLVDPLWRWAAG